MACQIRRAFVLLCIAISMLTLKVTASEYRTDIKEYSPSIAEQIANVASLMPLSEKLQAPARILKLGAFCDSLLEWLNKDIGVKAPMDKAALITLFIVASYIPTLILTAVWGALFKKRSIPTFNPMMNTGNKDAVEMANVLKTVGKI